MFTYAYPRPALTVDCVIFGWDGAALKVLLIRRGAEPFLGQWALPGGFVQMEESLEAAAKRELQEETGLKDVYMEQLATLGAPDRDPRGRVVSVAYFSLINLAGNTPVASTDASDADWFSMDTLPGLAFDHSGILKIALERLRGKISYRPVGFELLPQKFPLSELQRIYEAILGSPMDKRNFRKKVLSTGLLRQIGEKEKGVAHRAAQLFSFDEDRYRQLTEDGFQVKFPEPKRNG
jgi:8-oxo-dGTP diphosphatase